MNTILDKLPIKFVSVDNEQTLESVTKRLKQLKSIVADKRRRNILDKDKTYTYHIYKWIFGGKTRFGYCDSHDWETRKKVNGIKHHDTITI